MGGLGDEDGETKGLTGPSLAVHDAPPGCGDTERVVPARPGEDNRRRRTA
jgi:hypothetical protein